MFRRPRLAFAACILAAPLAAQVVTLTAPDPSATEAGIYPGLFRVERTGPATAPLLVNLAWSGTATPGDDYETGPASVTIPAGSAFLEFPLLPINDAVAEADPAETAIATLQPDPAYTVGSTASATVVITGAETLAQTAPFLHTVERVSATSLRLHWLDLFETETHFRVQYRATGTASWISINNLPADTTAHTVTGLVAGQPYEFRVQAFQNATSSLTPNPVVAVPLPPDPAAPAWTTFEQWRRAHGLATTLRATAGATTHDPDADGRPNFLEYALGSAPLSADSSGLVLAPSASGLALAWPENPALLDVALSLRESIDLAAWPASPLSSLFSSGVRTALDSRAADRRFYRLQATPLVATIPSARIVCWGDSLTGNPGTYAEKLLTLLPGRTVLNCGIGGDTSLQIADRLRGLTVTAPFPAFAASTPAGTPVRIVASRTTHARVMNPATGSTRATHAATIANVSRVEFFNRGVKIGESSNPLSATVTSNRAANPTRLLAAGHPFADGDVVHFPAGPLPSPLLVGKTYFVRAADSAGFSLVADDVAFTLTANTSRFVSANHDFADGDTASFRPGAAPPAFFANQLYHVVSADTEGFSLAATPGGPALTGSHTFSGVIVGKPARTVVSLAANFAAPTTLRGPFTFDWSHPGGATDLTLRTHTDRDADTFILWIGRNNNARPHEVIADLRAAVEHIKALDARFLVVSVTNGDTGTGETIGNQYYIGTVNLNRLLRLEFPDNFVDVRTALLRAANSSDEDQANRAADIPPASLRSDTVHFNDAGQQLIADLLAAELTRRGW